MKRMIISAILGGFVVTAHAQLKVDNSGQVYIQKNGSNYLNASLSVGETSSSYFDDPYYSSSKIGVLVQKRGNQYTSDCIGILSEVQKGGSSGYTVGVWGDAGEGPANRNIGVLGTIHPDGTGAGVYGTDEGGPGPFISGAYAGYFYGDTYVDGSLTTWDFYNLSDMRIKENIQYLKDDSSEKGTVLERLGNLDVISYTLKRPDYNSVQGEETKVSERKRKDSERRHYGVSAQELQKIFPELVKEGQDGYLAVSYTEMVPVLLQCIQELKQEVDELRGESSSRATDKRFSEEEENENGNSIGQSIASSASLKQNTPNPFSERTTIYFSLPEGVQQSYIYIFDMQGKTVKQIPIDPSMNNVTINGYELQSGMYLYSLVINGQEIDTKKMILSK